MANFIDSLINSLFGINVINQYQLDTEADTIMELINANNIEFLPAIKNLIENFERKWGFSNSKILWRAYNDLKKKFFEF